MDSKKLEERLQAVLSIHGGHKLTNLNGDRLWSTKEPVNITALAKHAMHEIEQASSQRYVWLSLDEYAKSGNRIRIRNVDEIEYDGWYEENLARYLGMDAEWNLIELWPLGYKKLPLPPESEKV